jgi:hypothetical protein
LKNKILETELADFIKKLKEIKGLRNWNEIGKQFEKEFKKIVIRNTLSIYYVQTISFKINFNLKI